MQEINEKNQSNFKALPMPDFKVDLTPKKSECKFFYKIKFFQVHR